MPDSVGCRMCDVSMPGSGTGFEAGFGPLGAGDLRRLTGSGGAANGGGVGGLDSTISSGV